MTKVVGEKDEKRSSPMRIPSPGARKKKKKKKRAISGDLIRKGPGLDMDPKAQKKKSSYSKKKGRGETADQRNSARTPPHPANP